MVTELSFLIYRCRFFSFGYLHQFVHDLLKKKIKKERSVIPIRR
nr:MAG TPA: hypothetical protein [Caudoviricetes sp.]